MCRQVETSMCKWTDGIIEIGPLIVRSIDISEDGLVGATLAASGWVEEYLCSWPPTPTHLKRQLHMRPHSWVWQCGTRLASRQMSVRVYFSSPFSSKFAAYGHYHATNFASPSEWNSLFQHTHTHIHTHTCLHAHTGKPCSNQFSVQKGEDGSWGQI